jgi:hypothetical protein
VKLHDVLTETKLHNTTSDHHNILEGEAGEVGRVFLMPLIPNFEGLDSCNTASGV